MLKSLSTALLLAATLVMPAVLPQEAGAQFIYRGPRATVAVGRPNYRGYYTNPSYYRGYYGYPAGYRAYTTNPPYYRGYYSNPSYYRGVRPYYYGANYRGYAPRYSYRQWR